MNHRTLSIAVVPALVACTSAPDPVDESPFSLHAAYVPGGLFERSERVPATHNSAWHLCVEAIVAQAEAIDGRSSDVRDAITLLVDLASDTPLRSTPGEFANWSVVEDGAGLENWIASAPPRDAKSVGDPIVGALFDGTRARIHIADLGLGFGLIVARSAETVRLGLTEGEQVGALPFGPVDGSTRWFARRVDSQHVVLMGLRCSTEPAAGDVATSVHRQLELATELHEHVRRAPVDRERIAVELAWTGLLDASSARASLLALAWPENSVARDFAWVAPDDALLECARQTHESVELERLQPADSGWIVERSVLAAITDRVECETCSQVEPGLLLRHYGALGRYPADVARIATTAEDAAAFAARVVDENLLALRSSDPSTRVRAFDWLAHRDLAPAGFDPFADRDTRRRVLSEFEEAR